MTETAPASPLSEALYDLQHAAIYFDRAETGYRTSAKSSLRDALKTVNDLFATLIAERDEARAENVRLKNAHRRDGEEMAAADSARDAALAKVAEMTKALEPFAAVAHHDIGVDETDSDYFMPANKYHHAPRLTVGDFRRVLAAISKSEEPKPHA